MERLKTILNQYFWLIVLVFFLLVGFVTFSIYGAWQTDQFNQTISNQSSLSNKAVQEAVNANAAAQSYDAERQTEDARRETAIKPKLENARRKSQNSKAELDAARKTFNETNNTLHNPAASRSSNCTELNRLFPDTRFEYCHD